jgi:hypothetical protein
MIPNSTFFKNQNWFNVDGLDTYMGEESDEGEYEFVKPYTARIPVGGVVGIMPKEFKVGDKIRGKYSHITYSVKVKSDLGYIIGGQPGPTQYFDVPIDVLKPTRNNRNSGKEIIKNKLNLKNTFSNPFKSGFKKYVVIEDFVGYKGRQSKKFKKGMNLFAIITYGSSRTNEQTGISTQDDVEKMITYAGFEIPISKVREKKPNIYERIQKLF